MKQINVLSIICLLLGIVLFSACVNAQEIHHAVGRRQELKSPLPVGRCTVFDFLKSFVGPEQFAELELTVNDVPNGYLRFSTPFADVFDESFVLFRRDDDTVMIAYTFISCGPACAQEISVYTIDDNAFVEVTNAVISEEIRDRLQDEITRAERTMEYAGPLFVLPHYGRTIEVWLADDGEKTSIKLMDLLWNGSEFVRKQP